MNSKKSKKQGSKKPVLIYSTDDIERKKQKSIDKNAIQDQTTQAFEKSMKAKLQLSGSKDVSDKFLLNRLIPQNSNDDVVEAENYDEISDEEAEDRYQKIISKNKITLDESDQESDENETHPSTSHELDGEDDISVDNEDEDASEDEDLLFSSDDSDDDDTKIKNWKKSRKDIYVEKESGQQKKKFASKEDRERSLLQKIDEEKAEIAQVLASTKTRSDRLSTNDILGDFQTGEEEQGQEVEEDDVEASDESLNDEEKMNIIKKESPELVELVEELKRNLKSIRSQLHPLMTKVKSNAFVTEQGISYLEVKYHLMLQYCISILFYLLLKSSGKSVKNHPVIGRLVELKVLIEQIRPIDEKMKNQLEKLIKIANSSKVTQELKPNLNNFAMDSDEEDEEENSEEDGEGEQYNDDLESLSDGDEDSESDVDDPLTKKYDSDEETTAKFLEKNKAVVVEYDESGEKKLAKKLRQVEKKTTANKFIREIRNEFGDEPEEEFSVGAEHKRDVTNKSIRILREIEEAEEDNFRRLQMSKRVKKHLLKDADKHKLIDELENLEELANNPYDKLGIDAYFDEKDDIESKGKKVKLIEYIGDEGYKVAEKKIGASKEQSSNSKKRKSMDFDEDDEEQQSHFQRKNKQQRMMEDQTLDRSSHGKRAANKKMMDNRGLVQGHNSKRSNSKKKIRTVFEKKTHKYSKPSEAPTKISKEVKSQKFK